MSMPSASRAMVLPEFVGSNCCVLLGNNLVADDVASGLLAAGWMVHRLREGSDGEITAIGEHPSVPLVLASAGSTADLVAPIVELRRLDVERPIAAVCHQTAPLSELPLFDAGADVWLPVPPDITALIPRLLAVERRAWQHAGRFVAGRIVLDRMNRAASVDGIDCGLTSLEFSFLWLLFCRRARSSRETSSAPCGSCVRTAIT